MSAVSILTKIPWGKIARYGPSIISMAERIFTNLKESGETGEHALTADSLAERISALESNELQQAELISNLARQSNEIAAALRIVSRRILFAFLLSAAAFIISIASLFR